MDEVQRRIDQSSLTLSMFVRRDVEKLPELLLFVREFSYIDDLRLALVQLLDLLRQLPQPVLDLSDLQLLAGDLLSSRFLEAAEAEETLVFSELGDVILRRTNPL